MNKEPVLASFDLCAIAYAQMSTDVMHAFFKINELQFSGLATAIDSSELLRNIRYS
jgi:hypothetical protein